MTNGAFRSLDGPSFPYFAENSGLFLENAEIRDQVSARVVKMPLFYEIRDPMSARIGNGQTGYYEYCENATAAQSQPQIFTKKHPVLFKCHFNLVTQIAEKVL